MPDHTPVFAQLPVPAQLDGCEVSPEQVLDIRLVKKGNKATPQVLIKWSSLPVDYVAWEDYNVVRHRFPKAVAWGQATGPGGKM